MPKPGYFRRDIDTAIVANGHFTRLARDIADFGNRNTGAVGRGPGNFDAIGWDGEHKFIIIAGRQKTGNRRIASFKRSAHLCRQRNDICPNCGADSGRFAYVAKIRDKPVGNVGHRAGYLAQCAPQRQTGFGQLISFDQEVIGTGAFLKPGKPEPGIADGAGDKNQIAVAGSASANLTARRRLAN